MSKFVAASEVMHVYEPLRPGQVRGVPWFAPVLLKFRDVAEYDEAELVKKKIESCLAAFVTQPEGEAGAGIGKRGIESGTGSRTEVFRPGMVEYLKPGEDVRFGAPSNNSMFSDYWVQQLHSLAVGMNVMYEHLSGDLSRVNYSSFRGGRMVYIPFIEMLRWNMIVPLFCQPVWDRCMEVAYAVGKLPQPTVRAEWTPPKFQSVDPEKDANAGKIELRNGGITWPEYVAERGYEPNKQLATIAEWQKKFDEAEVKLDCDPRYSDASGKAKGEGNGKTEEAAAAVE
jgi:lambda family phage portal protein